MFAVELKFTLFHLNTQNRISSLSLTPQNQRVSTYLYKSSNSRGLQTGLMFWLKCNAVLSSGSATGFTSRNQMHVQRLHLKAYELSAFLASCDRNSIASSNFKCVPEKWQNHLHLRLKQMKANQTNDVHFTLYMGGNNPSRINNDIVTKKCWTHN